jgi:hypothetical protein
MELRGSIWGVRVLDHLGGRYHLDGEAFCLSAFLIGIGQRSGWGDGYRQASCVDQGDGEEVTGQESGTKLRGQMLSY